MLGRLLRKRLWIWRGWMRANPIIAQRANLVGTAFITALALPSPQKLPMPGPVWIIQSCWPPGSTNMSKLGPPVNMSVPVQSVFTV